MTCTGVCDGGEGRNDEIVTPKSCRSKRKKEASKIGCPAIGDHANQSIEKNEILEPNATSKKKKVVLTISFLRSRSGQADEQSQHSSERTCSVRREC